MPTQLLRGAVASLLIIDDEPSALAAINELLRREFHTRVATSGARALELAALDPPPDLIVLDVEMPPPNGYEVCRALKDDPRTCDVPLIFLSSHHDSGEVTLGLELGAVDYVTKPVVAPILLARIRTQLKLRETRARLLDQNRRLEELVSERTRALQQRTDEVQRTQELTIVALGALAETRDNETGFHIHRTQGYVQVMTDALARLARYRCDYDAHYFSLVWKSAPLHDIGKVGIPDAILLKPERLSAEEFEIMKQHTVLGRRALEIAERRVRIERSYLEVASQIAYSHHERWDGSGYPEGLSGLQIPLAARVMAVADVYDALVSQRVYKPPMGHAEAIAVIRDGRGSHFDPNVADCFLEHAAQMRQIALLYADQ